MSARLIPWPFAVAHGSNSRYWLAPPPHGQRPRPAVYTSCRPNARLAFTTSSLLTICRRGCDMMARACSETFPQQQSCPQSSRARSRAHRRARSRVRSRAGNGAVRSCAQPNFFRARAHTVQRTQATHVHTCRLDRPDRSFRNFNYPMNDHNVVPRPRAFLFQLFTGGGRNYVALIQHYNYFF